MIIVEEIKNAWIKQIVSFHKFGSDELALFQIILDVKGKKGRIIIQDTLNLTLDIR